MILHKFVFGDVDTEDYGIYVFSDRVYDAPKRDIDIVDVPGKNGDLTFDNGRYLNITVTYGCIIMHEFADEFDDFRAALFAQKGYKRLTDTFHPDEYRMGFLSESVKPKNVPNFAHGNFEIKFNCKPQRWLLSGEQETVLTTSGTIENPTHYDALPLLRVIGYGTIGIGEYSLTVAENSYEYIDIDCDLQDAFFDATNANSLISVASNGFPQLHAGVNGITLPATVTSLTITPRWWTL